MIIKASNLLLLAILLLAGCSDADLTTSPARTIAAHGDHDGAHPHADGLDLDLYFDGALAQVASNQACNLVNGTQTSCRAHSERPHLT